MHLYTTPIQVVLVGAHFQPLLQIFFCLHRATLVLEVWIWPRSLSTLLWYNLSGDKQSMDSRGKLSRTKCLLQILSNAFDLEVESLPMPHSKYIQNKTKDCKLQTVQQLSPTACCKVFGQDRIVVIVVVISAPSYLSSSLKNRTKERKLQQPTIETVVVCNHTLSIVISSYISYGFYLHFLKANILCHRVSRCCELH